MEKAKTRQFRRAFNAVRPAPELVGRQSEAMTLAFQTFGDAEAARRFLNEPHERLGGRPIDIAGASPEGLRHVVDEIRSAEAPRSPDGR